MVNRRRRTGFARRIGRNAVRSKSRRWRKVVRTRTACGKTTAILHASVEAVEWDRVMKQLHRLPVKEIILITDDSLPTEQRAALHEKYGRHTIISMDESLGHEVWRSVGARMAQSDILLFLDGGVPVSAEKLARLIRNVANGCDVALNHHAARLQPFFRRDRIFMLREFLNSALGRPQLGLDSLIDMPHALSSRAVRIIGYELLMVPPKAQAAAICGALKITSPVIARTRHRPVTESLIGDHMEALHWAAKHRGERLEFHDTIRRREMAGG